MAEKSNNEILTDFAKSTNRLITIDEKPYPANGFRGIQHTKRRIFVPNNADMINFYIWFSDPLEKIGQSTVLSGAFIPLPSHLKSRINIRNKYILDKLKVFSKSNEVGSGFFDSKVVIKGEMDAGMKRLLSKSRIQEHIINALSLADYMQISINEYNIDFVPELKDKPYLSIINPQSWDTDKKTIEQLFWYAEKIRDYIDEN